MKTRIIVIAMLAISTLFVSIQCSKETNEQQFSSTDQLIQESEAMTAHILAFQEKLEYYRDNPSLKSSENKYVLDAINDWEATINMLYCHSYQEISEIAVFDTIIPIPLIPGDSMEMTDVSERYYNAILASVQTNYYVDAPFANQILVVVDLEPVPTYDSVLVNTWIGNTLVVSHPPDDWLYGDLEGTCGNQLYYGESDAAKQSANYVRNIFYEDPPSGNNWYFINIQTIYANPLDKDENDDFLYLNPDDGIPNDNYKDYLIFYAAQIIPPGLVDTVKCLESYPELHFYKQSYVDLTQDWIDDSNGKKFKECEYEGKNYGTCLQHELETKIGKRYNMEEETITLPQLE
ncbi:MAG: hypothetical protein RQ761_03710 [Bacteroidales bacterium]|nr:hypothetical protein [Bacteroidales bacterium]